MEATETEFEKIKQMELGAGYSIDYVSIKEELLPIFTFHKKPEFLSNDKPIEKW